MGDNFKIWLSNQQLYDDSQGM